MAYLLDADTFIRAKNDHYGFDLCPGFWQWLVEANEEGIVYSNEAVLDELLKFGKRKKLPPDELAVWAKARGTEVLSLGEFCHVGGVWKPYVLGSSEQVHSIGCE